MAPLLKQGGVIGHYTSTLPGVACLPQQKRAIARICRFKKRHGPFLLLIDSKQTARRYIRWYSRGLRQRMKSDWPGRTTLVVPGAPGLPSLCYRKGMLAMRVDADGVCRRLAKACGGVLLSSSLNRRGGAIRSPCYALQMRWQRFLAGRAGMGSCAGEASAIYRMDRTGMHKLR